ncbi:MAG TPA: hypothetical protein VL988_08280 [Solirubrobacteraceae bacterium]|nr:hypothetical protein [Solirubrobacteraceae bacterium]
MPHAVAAAAGLGELDAEAAADAAVGAEEGAEAGSEPDPRTFSYHRDAQGRLHLFI